MVGDLVRDMFTSRVQEQIFALRHRIHHPPHITIIQKGEREERGGGRGREIIIKEIQLIKIESVSPVQNDFHLH